MIYCKLMIYCWYLKNYYSKDNNEKLWVYVPKGNCDRNEEEVKWMTSEMGMSYI